MPLASAGQRYNRGDTVGFTQEFLAEMLGVQWTTVSLRLKRFNKPGY